MHTKIHDDQRANLNFKVKMMAMAQNHANESKQQQQVSILNDNLTCIDGKPKMQI